MAIKPIKLGVIMDPIANIDYQKDSTLAMLWAANARGWEIFYLTPQDLFLRDGHVLGNSQKITVHKNPTQWYSVLDHNQIHLADLDVIIMRKDPPFNLDYIYTTYLLELVAKQNVLVINNPQSLRDANEKLFITHFPQCCPPTLVTCNKQLLKDFWQEQKDIVCKPLDGMGGASIFRLQASDSNASVVFELLTRYGQQMMMAQKYIPEIVAGDKRILLIDGEPMPYALARVPAVGELRGNLVAGAKGKPVALTDRDKWICAEVGPTLRAKGLVFVGMDVIGDYLTEINVTSPTCIRELDELCGLDIAGELCAWIAKKLA
jgi:glutathione synthase